MAIKKSQDARYQLHFWAKLLDGRIALQKVVVASRELEKVNRNGELSLPPDDATIKSMTKLLACMVKLRDSYRAKSQFNSGSTSETDIDPQVYSNIDDSLLDQRHEGYNKIRDDIIEKWCEKTNIGNIPKKGYTALELPTLQLINNALKDKERLIRRTQLDRTSHVDNATHPEVFNDDDFYHQLLKEVISKEEGRKWVELQRLKYKIKRKADTKATKGRKVKKDLIPKLVNFMAPSRPCNVTPEENVPDRIREELLKSLFGGSVRQRATLDSS